MNFLLNLKDLWYASFYIGLHRADNPPDVIGMQHAIGAVPEEKGLAIFAQKPFEIQARCSLWNEHAEWKFMLGILPFFFEIATILFLVSLAARQFLIWWKRPTNLYAITHMLGSIVVCGAGIFFLMTFLIPQSGTYLFLKTIRPDHVASIRIGDVSWTGKDDIQRVTDSLNQVIWHVADHESAGPFIDMTISYDSGQTRLLRVGRYNGKDAALVRRMLPNNDIQLSITEDLYIPALSTTLEGLNTSLPSGQSGYTPETKDYLFLWLVIGIYILMLWPRGIKKKRQANSVELL